MDPQQTGRDLFVAPVVYDADGRPRIERLLIANRGEIACRIVRTCKRVGVTSIAVYADVDGDALHVRDADESVLIGKVDERPYQDIKKLIEVAKAMEADAIHPGYGFLSENTQFAKAVMESGLIWVGPSAESINALGDKRESKAFLADKSHVPLIPGYNGLNQDADALEAEADKIGYPVMIKASAGGGGKGMRIVHKKEDFKDAFSRARSEAERSFGSAHCLIEKYIEAGKHVEIQIFGDGETSVSFFERECSVQRRHQKIIEESPCPWLSPAMRKRMSDAALEISDLLKYKNAGTVEFIVDIKEEKFYFLEVNTRIQVEHPITEEVTGVDLVSLQLFVASGGKLKDLPEVQNVKQVGHSIEARLCAEDPFNDFLPCTGKIRSFRGASQILKTAIDGVRYETGIATGSEITVYFDPLICKVVVWARDRTAAILKLIRVLKATSCLGLQTNQLFLQRCLAHPAFARPDYTASFITLHGKELFAPVKRDQFFGANAVLPALAISRERKRRKDSFSNSSFKSIPAGFRNQRKAKVGGTTVTHISCETDSLGYRTAEGNVPEVLVETVSAESFKVWDLPKEAPPSAQEKKAYYNKIGGPLVKRYYAALGADGTGTSYDARIDDSALVRAADGGLEGEVRLFVNGRSTTVFVATGDINAVEAKVYVQNLATGVPVTYKVASKLAWAGKIEERSKGGLASADSQRTFKSPMPCKILQILAQDGSDVKMGHGLLVVESMKTEVRMVATAEGKVKMHVKEGDMCEEGTVLCEVLAEEEQA